MHIAQPSPPRACRLLLVQEDDQLAELLITILTGNGYEVDRARDGQRGLHLGLTRDYDVMVIDRALAALDGLSLIRRLRERAIPTRALLITATRSTSELVDGLDAGADDYLIKPFEFKELQARLRALCRRQLELAEVLRIGSGHLDLGNRTAILPTGHQVELSVREFDLLRALAGQPRAVHSREDLRHRVFQGAASASIIDTYVYYLRRKLGRQAIRTIRSFGYQLGEL